MNKFRRNFGDVLILVHMGKISAASTAPPSYKAPPHLPFIMISMTQ